MYSVWDFRVEDGAILRREQEGPYEEWRAIGLEGDLMLLAHSSGELLGCGRPSEVEASADQAQRLLDAYRAQIASPLGPPYCSTMEFSMTAQALEDLQSWTPCQGPLELLQARLQNGVSAPQMAF